MSPVGNEPCVPVKLGTYPLSRCRSPLTRPWRCERDFCPNVVAWLAQNRPKHDWYFFRMSWLGWLVEFVWLQTDQRPRILNDFGDHFARRDVGAQRLAHYAQSPYTLSLLTLLDSNFPGNSLWAWELHPLDLRSCSSQTLWYPQC